MADARDDIVWELSDTTRMWWEWAMRRYFAGLPKARRRELGRALAKRMYAREQRLHPVAADTTGEEEIA